jgi:hypothetical protein
MFDEDAPKKSYWLKTQVLIHMCHVPALWPNIEKN